mmetsp:Transcript_33660/g.49294  ORF Transcript_33660/g.49294 Transcript_33660/m.49294 type:complete len:111 (-) Transcript_33660:243-575(-)
MSYYVKRRETNAIVPYNTYSQHDLNSASVAKKIRMKRQRASSIIGGTVGGAILGGVVLGPVGAVMGGAGGAAATRKVCKTREKRRQSRFEQRQFQQQVLEVRSQSTGIFA